MIQANKLLKKTSLEKEDIITWSGFNSINTDKDSVKPPAEIGIYPLFHKKAACASSMKHAMDLTLQGTNFLNPGQTSVLGADQPLYALIKRLQWQYPDTLGEKRIVVMMGAMHIEDKMHLMIGKILRETGWDTGLCQANVLTSGRAESTLNEHHIKRTRYAHQVSLMSLYNLKQRAYSDYCSNIVGPPEPFAMWDLRSQTIPQFKFWTTVMKLELLMSRFVRSLREGDFPLYVKSCDELCGWFHALDHTNYARWLPVHVRDMVTLEENHPEVHAEFMNGNFVVQKSSRKFSMIALDQAHEQSNKTLQAHGGATGLYENPEALSQFILAGPDCARIIEEFEATSDQPSSSYAHHEEGHSLQIKFHKDVKSFIKVLDQMGNPFQATGPELITLDTHSVMAQSVVESLSLIEETGKVIHATYVKQRLETSAIPVTNTIKRNNILTFSNRPNTKPKRNTIVGIEKQNMALITQLFLSLQSRPAAEMVEFFRYENQKEPPSLADRGFLRFGSKSDIMQCITDSKGRAADVKQATVVLMDMAAVVHLVKPAEANTFSEYVHNQILPFLIRQMKSATTRIDLVYDCYPQDNLKNLTHQRSGR